MQEPVNLLEPSAGLMFWSLAIVLGIGTLVVGGLLYFLLRHRRAKRSSAASPERAAHGSISALEANVAQLQTDVAQLELAQDFTTQLLAGKSPLPTTDRRTVDRSSPQPPKHTRTVSDDVSR